MSAASVQTPVAAVASGFRTVALLGLIAAVSVLLIFHSTLEAMISIWSQSETFAHGFVVFPISLGLLWNLRHRLERITWRPAKFPLLVLALAGFAWLVGEAASVAALSQASLIAMVICAVWVVWGHEITRAAVFPLAFLFFAVPFGDFLTPWLMQHTADFTVKALRLSGVPVYREGLQFVIPSGHWSVVEACSGIRYLIASVMVGVLFAYLNYTSLKRRALFVLASIIVPLVANWLRAYMIVMIGHLSDNRLATGVDHLIYGWFFFGLVIFALFWVGSWWRESERPLPVVAEGASTALPGAQIVRRALPGLLAVFCIAALWQPLERWLENVPMASEYRFDAPPEGQGGWVLSGEQGIASWTPLYVGERARALATYRKGDAEVSVFLAYYARQTPGHELIQWDNRLVTSKDKTWAQVEARRQTVFSDLDVQHTLLSGSAGKLVVWSWYWLGDRETLDERRAKLELAADRLARRADDSAVIVLWAKAGESPEAADEALRDFLSANRGVIDRMLRAVPHN
ncbi:MAG: exosortase A [Betaproteobacteria bacterium]|nr:exosortase A [Betaproteobacteria bacterium]